MYGVLEDYIKMKTYKDIDLYKENKYDKRDEKCL